MAYPFRVVLSDDQRADLRTLIGSGVAPARMLRRAHLAQGGSRRGWSRLVRRHDRPSPGGQPQHGPARAPPIRPGGTGRDPRPHASRPRLRAVAGREGGSPPPRRRLRRPAGGTGALESAPARRGGGALGGRAGDCVRNSSPHAQKNAVKPWLIEPWRFAPTAGPDFVRRMDDVLDVHERPYAAARPVGWLDETSRQLLGDTRAPHLAAPGVPTRSDPE